MEQKFVSFSLGELNHDSKIRNSTLSVNQIASRMTKTHPWNNGHSVCRRLKFSNFLLDYNLKVFHGRRFCYNFGMTMELYLFLLSKLWL